MTTPRATGHHVLGLSVGATNLVGARDGQSAVVHPCEATLHGQRLTGFVDRIGDPVPLVASDGTRHRPEVLLTKALGAVAQSVTGGAPASDVAIAVPAHWRPSVVDTLRRTMHDTGRVVSDASAALTALSAGPGLPARGVVVLCDFGGSGSSITLANASANYAVVGETVRVADFSGDHIDQALLTHVVSGIADAAPADPSGTAMVGALTRLRDECRRAKERLSAQTATAVAVQLPRHRNEVRVTRGELEGLIQPSFADFLAALDGTLERYGVPAAGIAAVATVGGGARIPLLTQLLSEHLRAPVVTTPHPQLTAAEGAALIARRSRVVDAATTITPAAGVGPVSAGVGAATALFDAGQPSTTGGALAWSDDEDGDEELPYAGPATGPEFYQGSADFRPPMQFQHDDEGHDVHPQRRSPIVLFGLSAAAAIIATTVFAVLQIGADSATPVEAATTVTPSPAPAAPVLPPAPPAPQAPNVTTVVVQPAQRAYPKPRPQTPQQRRPQAPVTQHPPAAPPTTEPTPLPPTPVPPSPEPSPQPPSPEPSPEPPSPEPPPIDPGPGDGTTPPIDPGPGDGDTSDAPTPPIDPGTGAGE